MDNVYQGHLMLANASIYSEFGDDVGSRTRPFSPLRA